MILKELVDQYQMSTDALELVKKAKLLLVASIAGGGKDTVIKELLKTGEFHRIVSHTTRQPRVNHGILEQEGAEYHFIDLKTAEQMLKDQSFIEAKYVHGNVYGTSVAELALAAKKTATTDIDIQGVVEYLDVKPNTHAVFLLPPSVETWLARLSSRYGDLEKHKEEVYKRFRTAYEEIAYVQQDKRFILIVNDDLETTVRRINGVLAGEIDHTSEYAYKIAEHLSDYLKTKI